MLEIACPAELEIHALQKEWALISFWSPLDANSVLIKTMISNIADQFQAVTFSHVSQLSAPALIRVLDIKVFPTLMLFHKGRPVSGQSGFVARNELIRWLTAELSIPR